MTPGDPGFNPFPGLRPFDMDEEYLFFGREDQRKELVSLLREQRFVAVLGASGSGKSSLVRAGLLPALYGGVMTRAGSNWHIAVMRPGGHAITNLAEALFDTDLLDNEVCEDLTELDIEATLIRSSLGLIESARQLGLQKNENLLVVVDQFEELFRFNSSQSDRGSRDEAAAFVKMLVEAANQEDLSIYVVLTMRSDFFGDCSQFEELAEAVNKGEYLVPRLNRENKKTAIEGPVRVGGGEISPRLVQRLLNDLGDDPDQLPIMQHALMRTWDCWLADHGEDEPLDLRHYESTGGMDEALSRHADEVHAEASGVEEQRLTRQLFQALTEKGADNRGIRRPTPLQELCDITGAEQEKVVAVIDRFRKPGRTFLMPPIDRELEGGTIIDISHESLMRVWVSLGRWVDDEAQSARIYRRLAETAQLHADGSAGLYHDPDLQIALSWRENEHPTEAWGSRYHPEYGQAIGFLEQSHEVKLEEQRAEEAARERELEQAKRLAKAEQDRAEAQQQLAVKQRKRAKIAAVLAGLALIATAVAGAAWNQSKKSERAANQAKITAQENATKAAKAQNQAEKQEELAKKNLQTAEEAQKAAEESSSKLSRNLTRSDFVSGVDLLDSNRTSEGLAYLARAIRRDPSHWQSTMRAMSALENRNINLDMRPVLKHSNPAQFPIISNDGNTILTYVIGAEARVWNIATGELISEFATDTKSKTINLSPDGTVAADLDLNNTLHLWNTETGNKINVIAPGEGVITFCFLNHPKVKDLIATYNGSGALQIWNLKGEAHTPPLRSEGRFIGSRNTIPKISNDNKYIFGTFDDGTFNMWDVSSGEKICTVKHKISNPEIHLSPNSEIISIKSGNGRNLRWWNTITSQPIIDEIKLERSYRDVYFSPNSKRVFIAGYSSGKVSIKVFNTANGEFIFEPIKEEQQIWSLPHIESGRHFIVSDEKNMKIIDLRNGNLLSKIPRQEHNMNRGFFSPSGDRIAIIYENNSVRIWDSLSGDAITPSLQHNSIIRTLRFSDDGTKIGTTDGMENSRIWNSWSGELLAGPIKHDGFATFSGHKIFSSQAPPPSPYSNQNRSFISYGMTQTQTQKGSSLTTGKTYLSPTTQRKSNNLPLTKGSYQNYKFNHDAKTLITSKRKENETRSYMIEFWDTETRTKTHEFDYNFPLAYLETHPNKDIAILNTTNTLAHIVSIKSKEIVGSINHDCFTKLNSFGFANDINILGIAKGMSVYIWDLNSQKLINKIIIDSNNQNYISSISFTGDGKYICTGSFGNNEANIWEVSTGEKLCGPLNHENGVINSNFIKIDGRVKLITASADEKIRIWEMPSGKLLNTLDEDSWPVHIDLNNDILLTAGVGNSSYPSSVRIWDLSRNSKLIPNINYSGAIYAAKFMNSGEVIAAVDNNNIFRVWDTSTGKPLIDPVKDIYNVAISRKDYYAHKAGENLYLSRIPYSIDTPPSLLPNFIESVSGVSISTSGIAEEVSKERLNANINKIRTINTSNPAEKWMKWFISTPQNRKISPYSDKSFINLVDSKSKSTYKDDLLEALSLNPTNGIIYSRLARKLARPIESPRTETIDHIGDNNIKSRYVNYDTLNAGIQIELSTTSVIHKMRIYVDRVFNRNPTSYEISVSVDGINYTIAKSGEIPFYKSNLAPFEESFPQPINAKFIRIRFPTVRNPGTLDHFSYGYGLEISELEFLDASGSDVIKLDSKITPTNNEHKNYISPAEHYALLGTKLSPNNSESWSALADVYDLVGKHKLARKSADKALSINPNDPNSLLISAMLRERELKNNNKKQAKEFSRAIELVSSKGKKFEYLVPSLKAVNDLKFFNSTNLSELAKNMASNKPWGDSGVFSGLLSKHAVSMSGDIQTIIDHTRVLYFLNENNKALKVLETANKENPENPEILLNLGAVYEELSNTNLALNAFQKASRLYKMDNLESLRNRRIAFNRASSILYKQGKRVESYKERIKGKMIPRQKQVKDNYIDLSKHYNAAIDEGWSFLDMRKGFLSNMPNGLADLEGTKFDIRGVIQLSGRQHQNQLGKNNPFPKKIENIELKNKLFTSLDFLHAVTWQDPDGTPVANYIINYSDGTKHVLPIIYGEHVRDLVVKADIGLIETPSSRIAWRNRNVVLFKTNLKNPFPKKEIRSIDLESQNSYSNIFIIGITGNSDSVGGESDK